VFIPAGATSATFDIETVIVGSDTPVIISATLGAVTVQGTLIVTAPVQGTQTATATGTQMATQTATATGTQMATQTATATGTQMATQTATATGTQVATQAATATQTATQAATQVASATQQATEQATQQATEQVVASASSTTETETTTGTSNASGFDTTPQVSINAFPSTGAGNVPNTTSEPWWMWTVILSAGVTGIIGLGVWRRSLARTTRRTSR
jgi:hypothetical protein